MRIARFFACVAVVIASTVVFSCEGRRQFRRKDGRMGTDPAPPTVDTQTFGFDRNARPTTTLPPTITIDGDSITIGDSQSTLSDAKQNGIVRFVSGNIAVAVPASAGTAEEKTTGARAYARQYSPEELSKVALKDAVAMQTLFVFHFEQEMYASKNLVATANCFRGAASFLQRNVLIPLRDLQTEASAKEEFLSVVNGVCHQYNRMALIATSVQSTFDSKVQTSPSPLSAEAKELLKTAAKEGSGALVDLLKGLVDGYEHATKEQKNRFKAAQAQMKTELEKGLTEMVQNTPALTTLFNGVGDAQVSAEQFASNVAEKAEEIWTWSTMTIEELFSAAKETQESVDAVAATKLSQAAQAPSERTDDGELMISCLDPDSTPEHEMTTRERDFMQRLLGKKIADETIKKMEESVDMSIEPKVKGMLEGLGFVAAIKKMDPKNGITRSMTATINVDNLLSSDDINVDVEFVGQTQIQRGATDTIIGTRVVLTDIVVSGENQGVQKMSGGLFVKHNIAFTGGLTLKTSFSSDFVIVPPKGQEYFDIKGSLALEKNQFKLELKSNAQLGLDGSRLFSAGLGLKHSFRPFGPNAWTVGLTGTFDSGITGGPMGPLPPGLNRDVPDRAFSLTTGATLSIPF